MNPSSLFEVRGLTGLALLVFAGVLFLILLISFRSRATVFCQYLKAMAGIELKPSQGRSGFKDPRKGGGRARFLALLIKEALRETGPLQIPKDVRAPKKS